MPPSAVAGRYFSSLLASISAYIKKHLPDTEVKLFHVLINDTVGGVSRASEFPDYIREWKPDLIAFSLMNPHWHDIKPILIALKERMPDTPILIGGYQAITSSDETIAFGPIDFVCTGDGELPTADLILYLSGKHEGPVNGLWEKLADGRIQKTQSVQIEDLSCLPFPDYTLYEEQGHFRKLDTNFLDGDSEFTLPVMTGRGCPYRCTYCCNTELIESWRNKSKFLRKYPLEAMIDELIRLKETYKADYFEFWDELFMSKMKYTNDFLKLYQQKVGVPFSIMGRVEYMTADFCRLAADANCHTIFFGIESGSHSYRTEFIGRKMSNQQIIEASDNCVAAGIKRITFNIVGMPFEKKEQMIETLRLNEAISPEFFYFLTYIPLKGTRLYKLAQENDLLLDDSQTKTHYLDYESGFHMNIKEHSEGMTNEEFKEVCHLMKDFQTKNNRLSH